MNGKLTAEQRTQLKQWIGEESKGFRLLYRISRDGCAADVFHQKCNNQGPTVTVAYNTSGYIYGGYTSQSWTSSGTYVQDGKAFLFSLTNPQKYPVNITAKSVYCNTSYGPTFGGGHDLLFFTGTIQNVRNVFTLNTQSSFGNSYTSHGHSINNLTGGVYKVSELEVYALTDAVTDQWRKTPTWDDKLMTSLKGAVECYKPYEGLKLKTVNLLMIGPVGSGKSSFYNTISSIFRGRISSQAPAGSVEHSLTSQFRKYRVLVGDAGKPTSFRLCDTMGLEEGQGIDSVDVPFILDGNVPDMYRFNPASHVTPEIPDFNKCPQLKDKIHCVGFVLNSTKVEAMSEKLLLKIQSIRHHINQRAIPIVVLLTKVDQLCPMVFEDVDATFRSTAVKNMVDKTAELVGVPRSHVLPIKNYESEIELDVNVNILALLGLRQMLWFADDYLCNQADLLQKEEDS
ncbi:interferon-induced protein 44-like [Liolophura sinensis]|uniref:interferon-induced protein 44-like n=1 Tax=Liolophura sinensis TaxID=3198878 RepID=UPI0031587B93